MKPDEFRELRSLVQRDARLRGRREAHRLTQCAGKHRYDSHGQAARVLRKGLPDVHPYRCTLCGGWHVGSDRERLLVHKAKRRVRQMKLREGYGEGE